MSDDLVRRLNDLAAVEGEPTASALKEAADRIENLNYQIRVIQNAAKYATKVYAQQIAVYRQKLEEKPPIWHDDIQSLQERDAIMTDRIEKLEAALRLCACDCDVDCSKNAPSCESWIARKALEGKDDVAG
jgi:hypothetical protein